MRQINVYRGIYVQGSITIPNVEFSLTGVSSELIHSLGAISANFVWVTCSTSNLKDVSGNVIKPTVNTRITLSDGRVLEVLPFPETTTHKDCYEYTTPSEERMMIFTRLHKDKVDVQQS